MSRNQYVNALHPTVERSDLQTGGCQVMHERIRNGLWIEEDHCSLCADRVRSYKSSAYRIRDDHTGAILTADWMYWTSLPSICE